MVKMQNCGITIEVPAGDVNFYKGAGYTVVIDAPAPVEPAESETESVPTPAPVENKRGKK